MNAEKAVAAAAAAVATPGLVVAGVNAVGFTAGGVVGGSAAAGWMAAGAGATPYLVSLGQAVGATGSLVAGAGALTAVAAAGAVGVVTYAVVPPSAVQAADKCAAVAVNATQYLASKTPGALRATVYGTVSATKRARSGLWSLGKKLRSKL